MNKIFIVNQQGLKEPFSWRKVFRSAKRVGADSQLAQEIANKIQSQAFEGMTTREIFKQVRNSLDQAEPKYSLRFSLKEAMRKLGPTGFPFEKFIARVLTKEGFKVKLNQVVRGKCTDYEIDCLANKQGENYLVECKYRHLASDVVDVNDVLILEAKSQDIREGRADLKQAKALLITNAKFTTKAIKYASCAGIELLGWKYPTNSSLEKLIDKNKLYPITILPSLSKNLALSLNQNNIILVEDLLQASGLGFIPQKQLTNIISEAKLLL